MKNNFFIVIFLLVIAFIYNAWWFPGVRVANDYPIISTENLKSLLDIPRTWTERGSVGLGEYTVFTLWSWPLNLLSGTLANLGIDFSWQERIYLITFVMILGSYGIFKLGGDLGLKLPGKLAASLFFLTNTYLLVLIDGGQLNIAYAYSTLPLTLCYLFKAVNNSIIKPKIVFSLLVTLLGIFDIRFVFIFILLAFIYLIYQILFSQLPKKKLLKDILVTFFICAVVFALLNLYWLAPLVMAPLDRAVYQQLSHISSPGFINIGHAILLLSPHWYQNIFGKVTALRGEFGLFLILVFLAPLLKKKNFWVGFWLVTSIISIFLSKGTSEPLGRLYIWLYSYLPGFSLFRDSSKFLSLIAISYSFLIGTTFDELYFRTKKSRLWHSLLIIFFITITAVLTYPIWLGKMTGTFSWYPLVREFKETSDILQNDHNFSRIFWIPATHPLSYSSPNHPIVEAARLYNMAPFVYGVKGSYEAFNFLREGPFTGEMFDVLGISRIVYPPLSPKRGELSVDHQAYYQTFLSQLSNLSWIQSRESGSSIPTLLTKKHQDRFFIAPNTWALFGPVSVLNEAAKSSSLALSKNALIFMENEPALGRLLEENPQMKIILKNRSVNDIAASFIDKNNFFSLASNFDESPNSSGWWKRHNFQILNWRDFLKEKYDLDYQDLGEGGGWAVAEGVLKMPVRNKQFQAGKVLLARVLESSQGGELRFYQDNQEVGSLNTFVANETSTRWFYVGKLVSSSSVEIRSSGKINVVNLLASVDENEWTGYTKKGQLLMAKVKSFNPPESAVESVQVTYKQINPTKYIVSVMNISQPVTLVFSSTYDKGWEMNKVKSVPVFGLLNGFVVSRNGEYTIEFKPQRYVVPGLVISALTLGLILVLLVVI